MSQENNQKVVKYDLVKEIRTEYNQEILDWLKENHYKFKILKIKDLVPYQTKEEINEELPFVELDPELYQKLKKISEITGISMEDMASNELDHILTDFIPEEPFIFLDIHLGIENVKDPITIIEQLKEIINIGDKYFEALKTMDPVKYVKEWNTGRIKTNK